MEWHYKTVNIKWYASITLVSSEKVFWFNLFWYHLFRVTMIVGVTARVLYALYNVSNHSGDLCSTNEF